MTQLYLAILFLGAAALAAGPETTHEVIARLEQAKEERMPEASTARKLTELPFRIDPTARPFDPESAGAQLTLYRRRDVLADFVQQVSLSYFSSPSAQAPETAFASYLTALDDWAEKATLEDQKALSQLARKEEADARLGATQAPSLAPNFDLDGIHLGVLPTSSPSPAIDYGKLAARAMGEAAQEAGKFLSEGIKALEPLTLETSPSPRPSPDPRIALNTPPPDARRPGSPAREEGPGRGDGPGAPGGSPEKKSGAAPAAGAGKPGGAGAGSAGGKPTGGAKNAGAPAGAGGGGSGGSGGGGGGAGGTALGLPPFSQMKSSRDYTGPLPRSTKVTTPPLAQGRGLPKLDVSVKSFKLPSPLRARSPSYSDKTRKSRGASSRPSDRGLRQRGSKRTPSEAKAAKNRPAPAGAAGKTMSGGKGGSKVGGPSKGGGPGGPFPNPSGRERRGAERLSMEFETTPPTGPGADGIDPGAGSEPPGIIPVDTFLAAMTAPPATLVPLSEKTSTIPKDILQYIRLPMMLCRRQADTLGICDRLLPHPIAKAKEQTDVRGSE